MLALDRFLVQTLCCVLWISPALCSGQPSSGKYISPDRSFELALPLRYGVLTGSNKTTPSYIPLCQGESAVCITFPNDRYKGTTFNGASVQVTVLAAQTRQACLEVGKGDVSASAEAEFKVDTQHPSRLIDGRRFLHSSRGGAAAGHCLSSDRYRGFVNGRCYELETRVTFTNFGDYSPGTIKEFTRLDQLRVAAELSQVVGSFRSFR